jgi:hypothetical protein
MSIKCGMVMGGGIVVEGTSGLRPVGSELVRLLCNVY